MDLKFRKNIQCGCYEFVLLIVFYLLHNYNEYFKVLELHHFFQALAVLLFFSVFIWISTLFFIKDARSHSLFVFVVLFVSLYYQGLETFLELMYIKKSEFFSKVVCLLLIVAVFVVFRKMRIGKSLFFTYLKVLLFTLVGYELCWVLVNEKGLSNVAQIQPYVQDARDMKKPDVYLIVMDEYAGFESLQNFGVSNSDFLTELNEMGFHVIKNAKSNYNYTVPSVASFLNSEYLALPKRNSLFGSERYRVAIEKIYLNRTAFTFSTLGYKIYNYSPFRFRHSENSYHNGFVPVGFRILLSFSILDELYDLLPLYLARRFTSDKYVEKLVAKKTEVNMNVIADVLHNASSDTQNHRFFYVHLMMPHAPYAFTGNGKVNVKFMRDFKMTDVKKQQAYIEYLFYTNKVVSSFIRELKRRTNERAVILLISDHGARDLAKSLSQSASFNSFNAMFWPSNYKMNSFYDGMSNINLMPLVFSTITQTRVPLSKDSLSID